MLGKNGKESDNLNKIASKQVLEQNRKELIHRGPTNCEKESSM